MILSLSKVIRQKEKTKTSKFVLMLLLFASCKAANANSTEFYFSLGYGFSESGKSSVAFPSEIAVVKQHKGKEQRGAMGITIAPLRLELEGSLYKSNYRASLITATSLASGSLQRTSVMGNLYYDFLKLGDYISPFVGAGIGVSKMKNILNINSETIKQAESKFSFQGMTGLKIKVAPNVDVTIDYRYFTTQKMKFNHERHKTKSINVGIMFRF